MNTGPKYIAYQNKGQDRDHNVYTEEFLGGADTYIYINGELFKDISAIQYTIREQQKPIYGYASRIYDEVATGVRIVQGLIKVPVRNTEYNELIGQSPYEQSVASEYSNSHIPDWLYRYTPEKTSKDTPSEQSINNEIYNIQEKLKNEGYKVDLNGVLDNKTKVAILKHKKNSGEVINLKNINSILKNEENI